MNYFQQKLKEKKNTGNKRPIKMDNKKQKLGKMKNIKKNAQLGMF